MRGLWGPAATVGRQDELGLLATELGLVRSRAPRVVLVGGAAGVGKTHLVDRFLAAADRCGLTVLAARGEPAESDVRLGLLGQLLAAASPGDVEPDGSVEQGANPAVAAGRRLLAGLARRATRRPVVLRVEDVQWFDPDSLTALVYAARRLGDLRVLTVATCRTDDDDEAPPPLRRLAEGASGRTLLLDGLAMPELAELARRLTGETLSPSAARRLWEQTNGNPLWATALVEEFGVGWLRAPSGEQPVPREYAAVVRRRLVRCSKPARRLVAASAVLGAGHELRDVAAVADIGDAAAALDEAARWGLLDRRRWLADVGVSMRHPLDRSAVLHALDVAERSGLHARAAAQATDPDVRLHHAVRATTGTDPELAQALAGHATSRAASGALTSAATWFGTAASVAPDGDGRDRLLLAGVEVALAAGQAGLAADLLGRLPPDTDSPRRAWLEGWLAFDDARLDDSRRLLTRAWQGVDGDAAARAGLALCLGHLAFVEAQFRPAAAWARRAVRADPDGVTGAIATGLDAACAALVGDADRGLEVVAAVTDGGAPDAVRAHPLGLQANLLTWQGRFGEARSAFEACLSTAERLGQFSLLAQAWANYGELLHRTGDWDEAESAVMTAIDYAEDCRQEWATACVLALAAAVPARRGIEDVAEDRLARSRAAAARFGDEVSLVYAACAGMVAAHAGGDHEAVLRAAEPVLRIRDRHDEPGVLLWQPLYAEALVRTGHRLEADRVVARDEGRARRRGRRAALAGALRVRGLLHAERGDPAAAGQAFEASARHAAAVGMPFDEALALLDLGEHLARCGEAGRAERPLARAEHLFGALKAAPFVERARLAATAVRQDPVRRPAGAALTRQERAAAALVAEGLSNVGVAGRLGVGVKTVEFHLGNAFRKLGVCSRSQLTRHLLLEDGAQDARRLL